jgi:HEPN domain-containing protein
MNPLTNEWVEKAEGDFQTAQREFRVRKAPNYDAVCFHAQQCAEKYLKAFLQYHNAYYPKTHDLTYLVSLCSAIDAGFRFLVGQLAPLDSFAVNVRYPGDTATKDDAKTAVSTMKFVRLFIRQRLGLSSQ